MLRYMLDTNVCIYVLKHQYPRLQPLFNRRAQRADPRGTETHRPADRTL